MGLEAPPALRPARGVVIGVSALLRAYSSRKLFCRRLVIMSRREEVGYLGFGWATRGPTSHHKEPPFQTRPDIGCGAGMWDLSYPTKRLSYPVPLSCPLRAYLSVAPAHSDISVGSPYPLCSDLPKQMPWFHPLLLST